MVRSTMRDGHHRALPLAADASLIHPCVTVAALARPGRCRRRDDAPHPCHGLYGGQVPFVFTLALLTLAMHSLE
jgi:hypothetical protein